MNKFKLNEEGKFSITKPYESRQIIEIIKKNVNDIVSNLVITDGTSCMGGDLVNFCKIFKHVNGIEIDSENFKFLVENCKIFECKNVDLINEDYLKICKDLKQDIIYIDPPWGGVNYKKEKEVKLKMGDLELFEIVELLMKYTKYLFIKVPLNVCLDLINEHQIEIIYNKKRPVFNLLIFKKKCLI